MATELRADLNKAIKLVEQFVKRYLLEGALIVMVSIATISSIISWAKSDRASEVASTADIRSASIELRFETELQRMALEFDRELRRSDEQWSVSYREMKQEYRLAQMEIDDFRIIMNKAGLDEHVGEKP